MRIFRAAVIAIVAATAAGCGSGGGLFQQYRVRRRRLPVARRDGDGIREQFDPGAGRAARGVVQPRSPGPHRSRGRPRVTTRRRSRASSRSPNRAAAAAGSCTCASTSTTSAGWARRAPFAWSRYDLRRTDSQYLFTQAIGAAAGKPAARWDGTAASSSRSGCTCRARSTTTTPAPQSPARQHPRLGAEAHRSADRRAAAARRADADAVHPLHARCRCSEPRASPSP